MKATVKKRIQKSYKWYEVKVCFYKKIINAFIDGFNVVEHLLNKWVSVIAVVC